jgi:hypothetical protein
MGHVRGAVNRERHENAKTRKNNVWFSCFGVFVISWLAAVAGAAQAQHLPPKAQPPPSKPDCLVSDVPANAKPAPTSIPLDTRRTIFLELQQVIARAQREAAAAYPTAEGSVLGPGNVQKDAQLAGKRDSMTRALERSYLPEVLKKRGLTCAAARDIAREGRDAKWPARPPAHP